MFPHRPYEDFRKALEHIPNDDARYALFVNRGVLFRRQGKFAQAVADLKGGNRPEAGPISGVRKPVWRPSAAETIRRRRRAAPTEASARLQRLSKPEGSTGRPALLHLQAAVLHLDQADAEAALHDFRQAVLAARAADDHAECGRLLHGLGRFPEALLAYDEALKADPDHADAHRGRAETLFKRERYEEAVVSLDHYLKRAGPATSPRVRADAYRARGLTRVKLGRFANAVADFTLALSLEEDALTHAYRGWAYLVQNAAQLALPDFDRAIQLDQRAA